MRGTLSPSLAKGKTASGSMFRQAVQRIRGQVANAEPLKAIALPLASVLFGNPLARRLLENPGWQSTDLGAAVPQLEVEIEEIALPGAPFAVAASRDGQTVCASIQEPGGNERASGRIAVLRRSGDGLALSHSIELEAAPWGLRLLRHESLLAVANSHGVVLIDAVAARDAAADPILRTLHYGLDYYTMQVLASSDERLLFASDEHNNTITMIDIDRLLDGADAEAIVAQVPVDVAPVSMALLADGQYLVTTCEMRALRAPEAVNWLAFAATLRGSLRRAGTVCTIDLDLALKDPHRAVISKITAGGHPVRLAKARDGNVLFVSARASDQLLAFDTTKPETPVLRASCPAGPAPVGLAVLEDLGVLLVANSNRFGTGGAPQTVGVFDIDTLLAGRPACLGAIPTGVFPREIHVDQQSGLIYVSNFGAQSLTIIKTASLAGAIDAVRQGQGSTAIP